MIKYACSCKTSGINRKSLRQDSLLLLFQTLGCCHAEPKLIWSDCAFERRVSFIPAKYQNQTQIMFNAYTHMYTVISGRTLTFRRSFSFFETRREVGLLNICANLNNGVPLLRPDREAKTTIRYAKISFRKSVLTDLVMSTLRNHDGDAEDDVD